MESSLNRQPCSPSRHRSTPSPDGPLLLRSPSPLFLTDVPVTPVRLSASLHDSPPPSSTPLPTSPSSPIHTPVLRPMHDPPSSPLQPIDTPQAFPIPEEQDTVGRYSLRHRQEHQKKPFTVEQMRYQRQLRHHKDAIVILPRRGVGALTQDGIQSQGDHEFVAGESQEQGESQLVDDDGDAEDEEEESDHPRTVEYGPDDPLGERFSSDEDASRLRRLAKEASKQEAKAAKAKRAKKHRFPGVPEGGDGKAARRDKGKAPVRPVNASASVSIVLVWIPRSSLMGRRIHLCLTQEWCHLHRAEHFNEFLHVGVLIVQLRAQAIQGRLRWLRACQLPETTVSKIRLETGLGVSTTMAKWRSSKRVHHLLNFDMGPPPQLRFLAQIDPLSLLAPPKPTVQMVIWTRREEEDTER
jgi:hypothetical protein